MTEQALSEAGSRYSSKAQRAMRRGLSVNDVDEVLDPLTRRAMIPGGDPFDPRCQGPGRRGYARIAARGVTGKGDVSVSRNRVCSG
jgi:hypothetical protein